MSEKNGQMMAKLLRHFAAKHCEEAARELLEKLAETRESDVRRRICEEAMQSAVAFGYDIHRGIYPNTDALPPLE
jgi:hypothetical protein